ncbi:Ku protein [Amycolatopsis oliviviridis]|uniref:Non-homologous end joining protein Ku n=1 Tax=Amycolatopsis oliviviridis TaxID=1471590 RepID=A0ABQ3LZD3_9PSEU|nr:Ku protein [Amycolatopsis oliviviridis]GHH28145.1 non-homologous end joining protein Ku [Amycolatopsis oliviviridis]
MRPVWSGSLSLGLVTVPVRLYSAVEDHTVRFRQFQRGTEDRVRYRRVNERTGKEVDFDDIVKGYELDSGEYVVVEPAELDEIAPGRSKSLDIESFVELDAIDPMFFDKTYWLAPAKDEFERPYALLLEAMRSSGKAGIAKFVMRGREYLALVRSGDGVMVLNTLHFAADLRDPAQELPDLPGKAKARGKELDMAVNLIDAMSDDWRPEEYRDTYTDRVRKLIKAKKKGETITPAIEPGEPTKVVDLFEALSKSVESGKAKKSGAKKPPDKKDLSSLSKADLEKLARERNIKGRSKMTRAGLEKALKAS